MFLSKTSVTTHTTDQTSGRRKYLEETADVSQKTFLDTLANNPNSSLYTSKFVRARVEGCTLFAVN